MQINLKHKILIGNVNVVLTQYAAYATQELKMQLRLKKTQQMLLSVLRILLGL